jgi:cyclase
MQDRASVVSRRTFIAAGLSSLAAGALSRLSAQPPLANRGFASARKIGAGIYATISDPSKGAQTTCNGGFLVGKDSALLIEGFNSPAGAAFQFDALRLATKVPIKAALDTHFHYDHTMGNAFYSAHGIPLWAHADTARRISETYAPLQNKPREEILAPFEKRIRDAKTDLARAHAQTDLAAVSEILASVKASKLGLPTRSLDPKELPLSIDLGGLTAILEHHPGHSGTDIIVRVPHQNIVFTGDLLFQGKYPVTFDPKASISAWRKTLTVFASFDKETLFVPGHGQLCGQEAITTTLAIFDDITEQARKLFRSGTPLEDAKDLYIVPTAFKHYPIWSWGFVIGSAIELLYTEWSPGASTQRP